MPKVTINSGVSNAGIAAPDEALPHVEMRGEHGPEPVKLPEGWTAAPAPADAPDYASMQHVALKEEAKSRGLPVSGSKADLAARLSDHDAAQVPEAAEQQGVEA